jgi:hypothetical protein
MFARPDSLLVLLAGIALLVAGRRLFWLFVGVVGFAAGFSFATRVFGPGSEGTSLIVALVVGLLGVVLALAALRWAVAIAGFLVGGWAAAQVLQIDVAHAHLGGVLICLVAGLIAAWLARGVLEGGLIVLSSFAGASFILEALDPRHGVGAAILVGLTLFGIVLQAAVTSPRARDRRARLAN